MSTFPKVIGEGSYGCIHRPSLKCKNKNTTYKKKVSKILLNRHALKEMDQYLRVAKADKNADYYLGKPIICKLENNKQNIDAIQDCEENNNIIENLDDYSLLVMEDGGNDINIFVTKMKKMKKISEIKQQLHYFWIGFLHMFEGCELFLKHNIINHDIKPQNILYNEKTKRMNFIDFGLMQSYKKITHKLKKSDFWLAKHSHWSYPIEIQFLNKNRFDSFCDKSEKERIDFYSTLIYNIKKNIQTYNTDTIKTLFSYIIPSHNRKKFTETFFNDLLYMITTDICSKPYTYFLKQCLNTIDLYGIGFTLLYSLNSLEHLLDHNFYHDLSEFAYYLITPRLYERYSCRDAKIKYKELLEKHDIFINKYSNLKKTIKKVHTTSFLLSRKKRDKIIHKRIERNTFL